MSNFDYFKQYQAEHERIRQKIREEENPYHKQHIAEFEEMMDNKIRAMVPAMIEEHEQRGQVKVDTYFNGKRVRSSRDIANGLKDMLVSGLKHLGRIR